jgi:hypothetical protein
MLQIYHDFQELILITRFLVGGGAFWPSVRPRGGRRDVQSGTFLTGPGDRAVEGGLRGALEAADDAVTVRPQPPSTTTSTRSSQAVPDRCPGIYLDSLWPSA